MDLGGGNYNFHYTPVFTLIWATFFKIFGVANWVSRLFPIIFSLGSIAVFYQIVKKYFSLKTAIIACFLWIATPMFIYFGKMPIHEIPLMFFVLLTFWFYLNNNFKKTIFSTIFAMLVTWPGFFLVPVLTLFNRKYLVLFPIAFLLFGLHLTHDYFVTGDLFGGGLREILLTRLAGVSIIPYVSLLARWAWTYYFLLIPLSFLGILTQLTRPRRLCIDIVFLFFIYAIIYPIVFRDASYRHDYLLIYFWPFLALSSALVINRKLLAILIILLTLYSRWDFILALQNSSLYRESVKIGEYAKNKTRPGDKIQVISFDKTLPFDGWFAGYYSDRPAIYTTNPDEINPEYKTFYYFSGGKIKAGAEISNNGTK